MQPDKPHFSGGVALLISLIMTLGSILLSLPMYLSAEVSRTLPFSRCFHYLFILARICLSD